MSPVTKNNWGRMADNALPRVRAAVVYAASNAVTHASALSRVDTGAMRGGWSASGAGNNGGVVKRTVFNSQHYAIHHEHGTSKMPAKPMLDPAFDAVEATFLLMLQQAVQPGIG